MSTESKPKRERGEWATHNDPSFAVVAGKWVRVISPRRVRVMARAEGYAMVRRKGCHPFTVPEKELGPDAPEQPTAQPAAAQGGAEPAQARRG